tara:strand:- start:23273 stop:24880 length:1608 start_codon:yes stop_codon:yes gene_type:complete
MADSTAAAAGSGPSQKWNGERSAAGEHNPWILTGVISIATFMVVLDSTIVNVALPHIAGSLGISVRASTWTLTAFLIANAVVIPISSWLSDMIGRKRYYMISVALFTGASLLCALAPNLPVLVLFRILQGVGGGGLAVSEQSMLADSFPPEKRGMAFAAYAVVVVVGPILGPTVGGYITDAMSWHWIFLVNLPFGLLSLLLVHHFVVEPEVLERERKERLASGIEFDWQGLVLVALGLGSLTYVLAEGQTKDWFSSTTILIFTIVTVASLATLVWWELRHPQPVVRLRLLANRQFAIVIALIFMVGVILFGSTQIIPQMFQQVFGYTAFQAGLALSVGGVGTIIMMPLAGRLAGNVDPRLMVVPGFLMVAAGLWHFTTLSTQSTFFDLSTARLFQTISLPFIFVTVNTIAYVGLKPDQTTDASALLNVFRNIGGSVGISVAQTILATSSQTNQSVLTENVNMLNPNLRDYLSHAALNGLPQKEALGAVYRELVRQASFLAYVDVYQIVSLLIVIVLPLALLVRGPKPGDSAAAPI